jgi:carboxypeptidase C (cathepsin A)
VTDATAAATSPTSPTAPAEDATPIPDPVVREHRIIVEGKPLAYTTTTGLMPIRDDKGELQARLFYTYYQVVDADAATPRPLTVAFNGGPGSASVWLHMGGLAPRRVEMLPDGGMPKPPFKLVDNEYTWLPETDIVFVDPVDTGYSRAVSDEAGKKMKGQQGDIAAIGEFIRLFLSRYGRWTSPLFLAGESYGTFRAAGLAGYLVEKGIAFNGLILVSSVLNMQTLRFTWANDLPYALYLPTYAATAWFHARLDADQQAKPVRAFLDEVEAWTETVYVPALSLGDRLPEEEREVVLDGLARYTGLSRAYLVQTNLRIDIHKFCKELTRDELRTVGRLDSRFKGFDRSGVSETPDYDPSLNGIRPPFTSTINQYIRQELGYESDVEYHILRGLDWEYPNGTPGDTSAELRDAFAKNPYMQVFVASGYYDLATPYYATIYTMNHMVLDPNLRGNIHYKEYETGHMVYIDQQALQDLHDHVTEFIADALA